MGLVDGEGLAVGLDDGDLDGEFTGITDGWAAG